MAVDRALLRSSLCRNELFASVDGDAAAIDFLAERCQRSTHPAGDVLVREGEHGDTLIVLVDGEVKISKKTPAGEEYAVAMLRAADNPCIGELSLLDAEVRSATATATIETVALSLPRDAFVEFSAEFPAQATTVYRRLGRVLAARLRRANDDIVTLFQALLEEVEAQSVGTKRRGAS